MFSKSSSKPIVVVAAITIASFFAASSLASQSLTLEKEGQSNLKIVKSNYGRVLDQIIPGPIGILGDKKTTVTELRFVKNTVDGILSGSPVVRRVFRRLNATLGVASFKNGSKLSRQGTLARAWREQAPQGPLEILYAGPRQKSSAPSSGSANEAFYEGEIALRVMQLFAYYGVLDPSMWDKVRRVRSVNQKLDQAYRRAIQKNLFDPDELEDDFSLRVANGFSVLVPGDILKGQYLGLAYARFHGLPLRNDEAYKIKSRRDMKRRDRKMYNLMNSIAPEYVGGPSLEIVKNPGGPLAAFSMLNKYVNVFGIAIYASSETPDEKIRHAAQIMSEYLDNNLDGKVDNPRVQRAMLANQASLVMFSEEGSASQGDFFQAFDSSNDGPFISVQDLYAEEAHPNGAQQGQFDGSLEEVLHLITSSGYSIAYPRVFGERSGTKIAKAMDLARGGHFQTVPKRYPRDAWYTYNDRSCDYSCQISEYHYWALTSLLGGQNFKGRREEIADEWLLTSPGDVKKRDKAVFKLLTNKRYRFPKSLPGTLATKADDGIDADEIAGFVKAADFRERNDDRLKLSVRGEKYLFLNGVIGSSSPRKVQRILAKNPNLQVLVLTNVPGSADDTANLRLGRIVNRSGLNTYVPSEGLVASGGTDLFLAGKRRYLGRGASVGVHSWAGEDSSGRLKQGRDFPRRHRAHRPYLDYYKALGIPVSFYWFTLKAADANEIHIMSINEMKRFDMITGIVN